MGTKKKNNEWPGANRNGETLRYSVHILDMSTVYSVLMNTSIIPDTRFQEHPHYPRQQIPQIPILPMVLVNGSDGIGTGYSTTIPTMTHDDKKFNALLVTKLIVVNLIY